ncbi:MAG: O-sialoglycoprotein endopeptidase [Candidatus Pacearchaeota archaeon]|nr:MAG: O-sialoglycoprotein endopeptidase [Candidatus Pacearchaeota archaeon]
MKETKQKILYQGAEALIILKNKTIIKKRVKKSYRIKEIDEKIRKSRTKSESKLFQKASLVVQVPKIKKVDFEKKEIHMDFIKGKKLSEVLDSFKLEKQKKIFRKIGESVAKLHDHNIVHGDLTTSNMILFNENVFFIDFGLGFISSRIEDKAVDLHLLKEALEAKHFRQWKALFEEFLKGYSKSVNYEKVIEQLKKVEKRGRYKQQY